MTTRVRVGELTDFPEGEIKLVEISGTRIGFLRRGSTVQAIRNVCPHKGGPLAEGDLRGARLTCPWHGWTFDLDSCEHVSNARMKLPSYPVQVEDEVVYLVAP